MPPPRTAPNPQLSTFHDNDSMYTLHTVAADDDTSSTHSTPASLLLEPGARSYGTAQPSDRSRPSSGRVILKATVKMACLFLISTILLGGTLWLALPTLEE